MAGPLRNRFIWYKLSIPDVQQYTEWATQSKPDEHLPLDGRIIAYLNSRGEALFNFEKISKNETKLIFRATYVPSKPMTYYGKVFLAMFTQTEFHPTMKEEIQHQLKKFKELVEATS